MTRKNTDNTSSTSLAMVVIYLISSFFAGLIFSILAFRSRKNGRSGIGWIILSLLCISIFGFISYSLIYTSSPHKDAGWYWLGISTLIANGIAVLVVLKSFFVQKS